MEAIGTEKHSRGISSSQFIVIQAVFALAALAIVESMAVALSLDSTLVEGLGWRIDSHKPIEQVILEAAEAYRVKHGVKPDTCLLDHRLADEPFHVDGVVVMPNYPLAGHLLIGVADHD